MKDFNAGTYVNQGTYKGFIPAEINKSWQLENMEVIDLLSKADRQLGRLDMYSEYTPNIDLFIRMHVIKEATKSSKIEGTQTNIEEALQDLEEIAEEKRDDWEEVQNYVHALNSAIKRLEELPISSRLIKEVHGKHKLPGEFRTSQNWIGGASIADATFVPPPSSEVPRLMSDLERFIHNEATKVPELLKIALIHYQFETIHPFLDGNGRVGRLIITLYLVEKGILKKPILYLSDFFERNRSIYYDNLMKVREKSDLDQWLKFFLVGIIETAKASIETFDQIMKLQKRVDSQLQKLGPRTNNARKVVNQLYIKPLINAQLVAQITNSSLPTSYTLINELEELGILKEITGAKRGRQYWFQEYVHLFSQ
ncbi:MAG: Fic family protein [Balneolaceae bacterium]